MQHLSHYGAKSIKRGNEKKEEEEKEKKKKVYIPFVDSRFVESQFFYTLNSKHCLSGTLNPIQIQETES